MSDNKAISFQLTRDQKVVSLTVSIIENGMRP